MNAGPVVAIVDDDESVRHAIESLLASFGIQSQTFDGAEALLASPALAGFSCFVSDIVMSGISGFALAEQLRASGDRRPVIFLTAHKGEHYAARSESLGACCLLTKPFTTEHLMACVAKALAVANGPPHQHP